MPPVPVIALREESPKAVLVVLPTWVGDFVMATPFLRAIRTRCPSARITFLAEPNLKELIDGGPWMDEVLYWPAKGHRLPCQHDYRRMVSELRSRRFDWAVLLPNSFRAALVARLGGARRRVGYDRDGRGWLLTDRVPARNRAGRRFNPMPLVDYYADLAEALGCRRPDDRLELYPTPAAEASLAEKLTRAGVPWEPDSRLRGNDAEHARNRIRAAGGRPLVVIAPGAKFGAAKCWPAERFAEVADRMIWAWRARVVLPCGPGEEPIVRQIAANMRERACVFDDPRLTLGELKSLIRRADLLLCNDAGLRHFARAFDVPVVTVFGPTHTEWTRTSYAKERIVRIDVDCGPCQQRVCPLGHLKCMTGVTEDMVMAAAEELMGRPAALNLTTYAGGSGRAN